MNIDTIYNTKDDISRVDTLNVNAEQSRKSNVKLAFELSKQAIEIAEEIKYRSGLARACLNAGICSRLISNFEEALKYFERALAIYRQISDKKGESRTLNAIANSHLNLSNFSLALEYFDDCIYLLHSMGDLEFEASVLSNKGLSYQQSGDFKSSLGCYLQSLSIYQTCKKDIPYYLYNNLGIIYLEIGNYEVALKYFYHALKIEGLQGEPLDEGYTLANIGRTYVYMKDFVNSVTYLSEALIILKKYGNRQAEAQVYSNLGKGCMKLRYFPEAIKYFNSALKYYKEIGDKSSVGHTLCELGELYYELNDYVACKKFYLEGLSYGAEIKDEINEARNYTGLVRLYLKFSDFETVSNYSQKVIALAEGRKSYKELIKIYEILYEGYKSIGSPAADEYLEKHNENQKKLNALEEENLKIFTAYNNFNYVNGLSKKSIEQSLMTNGKQSGNGTAHKEHTTTATK
jgi:tetratricopeptide (TPR) repeat protein